MWTRWGSHWWQGYRASNSWAKNIIAYTKSTLNEYFLAKQLILNMFNTVGNYHQILKKISSSWCDLVFISCIFLVQPCICIFRTLKSPTWNLCYTPKGVLWEEESNRIKSNTRSRVTFYNLHTSGLHTTKYVRKLRNVFSRYLCFIYIEFFTNRNESCINSWSLCP